MQNANAWRVFSPFAKAGLCAALLLAISQPHAQTPVASTEAAATGSVASDTHADLRDLLPQHKLSGKARLTVWGFNVYDASLWVTPGWKADDVTALSSTMSSSVPFALELAYLRDFANTDIAERSIVEMRRSSTISEAQAKAWTAAMLRVFPNIKKGDRIMGVYRPGTGATFLVNGKLAGEVMDAEFARLFFGIWLSPKTSEPKLRSALLAGVS